MLSIFFIFYKRGPELWFGFRPKIRTPNAHACMYLGISGKIPEKGAITKVRLHYTGNAQYHSAIIKVCLHCTENTQYIHVMYLEISGKILEKIRVASHWTAIPLNHRPICKCSEILGRETLPGCRSGWNNGLTNFGPAQSPCDFP